MSTNNGRGKEPLVSFTLDGRSAPWVEGVVGDHTNVVGLSLPTLRALLGRMEISIIDIWSEP